MSAHTNGAHHLFDEKLDAFKSGMHKLVEKAVTKPNWFGSAIGKTTETIKAHPFAAMGITLGLGYAFGRILRR